MGKSEAYRKWYLLGKSSKKGRSKKESLRHAKKSYKQLYGRKW